MISYREQKIQLLYIKIFYINTLLSFSALPVDNANDYTDNPPWPRFCNKRRFNSKPTHHLFWNDQTTSSTLSEEQLVKKSGLLCLRLFVHPSTNELNELKDHTLYSNPKWLGLLLVDGKFGLFPSSTMFKTKWGSPILPLIIPGAPFDSLPSLPQNSVLLTAMASILRTATMKSRGWANPY